MGKVDKLMSLSLKESQAVTELANILYYFLPGSPHPMANQAISFAGVAAKMGLANFWPGGSKTPAIISLLTSTLERERGKFCPLILEVVKTGLTYRGNKNPLQREEILSLNSVIFKFGYKIPELWDKQFLNDLPSSQPPQDATSKSPKEVDVSHLSKSFMDLLSLPAQQRGFTFEKFLKDLFAAFDLEPHSSFRLTGEQIDGSLQLDGDTYLIEAKWTQNQTPQSDLLVFQGKVDGKSRWSRGIFISYSGFTADGLEAFAKGRSTSMISLTGEDLHFVLSGRIRLTDLIRKKARRAAETGQFHVSAYELL